MAEYYSQAENITHDDGLISDQITVFMENVSLSGGAAIERGMVLAGTNGVYKPVSAAADAKKSLVIAALNEDSSATITSAYSMGRFNENKINVGSLDIEDFRDALRHYNIILTERKAWE